MSHRFKCVLRWILTIVHLSINRKKYAKKNKNKKTKGYQTDLVKVTEEVKRTDDINMDSRDLKQFQKANV